MVNKVTQLQIILIIFMLSHETDACGNFTYSSQSATSSDSNLLATITDDSLDTCSSFPATSTGTQRYTDLTIDTLNWSDEMDPIVKISGKNLGCEENSDGKLYMIPVKTGEGNRSYGKKKTCRLGTVAPTGTDGNHECTYTCSLSGDYEALRLVRRSKESQQAEWEICEITGLIYIPTACGNLRGGTSPGGSKFSRMCDRLNGPITEINFPSSELSMRVKYGSVYGRWIGGVKPVSDTVSLQPGETIIAVTTYYDEAHRFPGIVTALKFTTSLGNMYGPYGYVTPTFKTFNGSELMYFSGRGTGFIDRLLFHFRNC